MRQRCFQFPGQRPSLENLNQSIALVQKIQVAVSMRTHHKRQNGGEGRKEGLNEDSSVTVK